MSLSVGPAPGLPRATSRLAALAVALAACDPTPDYPSSDPTLPGLIAAEADLVARDDAPLEFAVDSRVALSIPVGALPAGTRVKVRWLVAIGDNARPIAGAKSVYPWSSHFGYSAIEILPASLIFAEPATLTVPNFMFSDGACLGLLFAHPTDTEWQLVGRRVVTNPDEAVVKASIAGGGVWSLAYLDRCATPDGGVDARVD